MGTTAQKLQKLVENKQLIIDKVNNKAGTSFDINSKLGDVANAIENIQSGIDTSDVTATASDILKGKTAYTADGKVVGTIETYNGESVGEAEKQPDMLQARVDATNSCDYLFYYYAGDNVDYISGLDTSKVENMKYMFGYCDKITTIPQLNTSNVINMTNMFYNCLKLASVPQFDTSKVTSISYMFYNCLVLETIDITYYNISSTSNIYNLVNGCTALKSLIIREFGSYTINSNTFSNSGISNGTGYIYVPRSMVDTLKSATNWSKYASQIRALEDYTLDGTTTGELDLVKMGLEA